MGNRGLLFLACIYFAAGGGLGTIAYDFWHEGREKVIQEKAILIFTVVSNLFVLPVIYYLWRRRHKARDIPPGTTGLSMTNVLIHGLPFNIRIAVVVLTICWVTGVILPIVFGL